MWLLLTERTWGEPSAYREPNLPNCSRQGRLRGSVQDCIWAWQLWLCLLWAQDGPQPSITGQRKIESLSMEPGELDSIPCSAIDFLCDMEKSLSLTVPQFLLCPVRVIALPYLPRGVMINTVQIVRCSDTVVMGAIMCTLTWSLHSKDFSLQGGSSM